MGIVAVEMKYSCEKVPLLKKYVVAPLKNEPLQKSYFRKISHYEKVSLVIKVGTMEYCFSEKVAVLKSYPF